MNFGKMNNRCRRENLIETEKQFLRACYEGKFSAFKVLHHPRFLLVHNENATRDWDANKRQNH
jgi:hypothetical protein